MGAACSAHDLVAKVGVLEHRVAVLEAHLGLPVAPPTPAPPTPASHCPSTSSAGTSASVSIVSAVATRPISGREMSSSHGQLRVAKSAQST
jgi:hypothetical protein